MLAKNTSWQLTCQVLPEEADDKTVLWKSTNEAVATVDESGRVTAVGTGTTTITGTAGDGSKVKAQIGATVKAYDLVLTGDQSEDVSAVLFDGVVTVSGQKVTGEFDETKVKFRKGCAVIENGLLKPLKPGEDTVTLSYLVDGREKKGTFTLYVSRDCVNE